MNRASETSPTKWSPAFLWLATGGGLGYAPVAPGTVGSLWGIPLAMLLAQVPSLPLQIVVLVGLYALGVPLCTVAARALGKKDPGAVVWDEIVTIPLAFLFVEPRLMTRVEILALGFALHRCFDIAKPWPVKRIEQLPEGWGIMSDDVAAGAYACLSMHLLLWLWPWLSRA